MNCFLNRKSSVMNWSFDFLAQHEDAELGSMLQEFTICKAAMKT
jgi:hypothetical protein